jgi:hypothetical protein
VGTAFTVLLALMLLTFALGKGSRLLSGGRSLSPAEEATNESKDKALAAAIAVNIALAEEERANPAGRSPSNS